jgi:hypothetical protein
MLDRLESSYLSLLRVVIIVVATVSLIVAIGFLLMSVISFARSTGVANDTATGGSLAEFMEQQKPATPNAGDGEPAPAGDVALPDIRAAASNLNTYLGKRSKVTTNELVAALQKGANEMGSFDSAYAASLKKLTEDLKVSTGRPLSEDRVLQLVDWHHRNFANSLESQARDEASATNDYWKAAAMAGSAFLGFVLTIFIFLFVKIERNLRLVRTVAVSDTIHHHEADLRAE